MSRSRPQEEGHQEEGASCDPGFRIISYFQQQRSEKRIFGQKDCTMWGMREVRERSGVFIVLYPRVFIFIHVYSLICFSSQPVKKKKQFINKKNAVTFHLVHRSQRDPLQADEDAPQRVLLPAQAAEDPVSLILVIVFN